MTVIFGTVKEWANSHKRAVVVLARTIGLGVWLFATTGEPRIQHSSALSAVFDSRWMIAGVRTIGAVLALYIAVSVAARVQQGQWVKSVGPVATDVQGEMQSVADSQQDLQQKLASAQRTIQRLTARIEATDVLVAQLVASLEQRGGGTPRTPEQGEQNDTSGQG